MIDDDDRVLHDMFEDVGACQRHPPYWVIEDLLPAGITFLAGPPKAMKTTVELAMISAVAGIECEALPEDLRQCYDPGRVVGFCAEHDGGELKYMIEVGFGTNVPDDGRLWVAREPFQWRLDDTGSEQRLLRLLNDTRPRLFFLDPLRDFHGADEKEAGDMNRLLRPLQRWAKDNKAAFLVVHHTRKLDDKDPERVLTAQDLRGSSAIFGLADGVIVITPRRDGQVHFDVVHKRGQPWERTIKLGVWGAMSGEELTPASKKVAAFLLKMSGEGTRVTTPSYQEVAETLKMSKTTVGEAFQQLKRVGILDDKRQLTSEAPKLVANATRKSGG